MGVTGRQQRPDEAPAGGSRSLQASKTGSLQLWAFRPGEKLGHTQAESRKQKAESRKQKAES
jgi:hypothetical protein